MPWSVLKVWFVTAVPPDGRKILFLDIRLVNGVGRYGLATIAPDGSERQFISSNNLEEHQPDWESIPSP